MEIELRTQIYTFFFVVDVIFNFFSTEMKLEFSISVNKDLYRSKIMTQIIYFIL